MSPMASWPEAVGESDQLILRQGKREPEGKLGWGGERRTDQRRGYEGKAPLPVKSWKEGG